MRNLYISFLLFSLVMSVRSQTFSENYLGDHYQLYKGVYFKLNNKAQFGFIETFYSDLKYCQNDKDKNVIFPDKTIIGKTVIDSLKNKVFEVIDIIDKDSNSITDPLFPNNIFIVLKDTAKKQIIYYKYDKYFGVGFPFLTTKINYNDDLYCSKIEMNYDDFTDETTYRSPYLINHNISPIILYKIGKKGKFIYYLSLTTESSQVIVDGTGAIILFTDGTKLSKSCKVDVEVNQSNFRYNAFITLTEADLNVLSTKLINKFRLYVFDEVLNQGISTQFRAYVKCIRTKK